MIKIIVSQYSLPDPKEFNDFENQDDDLSFLADETQKQKDHQSPNPQDVQLVDDELDISPYPDTNADSIPSTPDPSNVNNILPTEEFQIPSIPTNTDESPAPPEENFEELKPLKEEDQDNKKEKELDLRGTIWKAMSNNLPLRMVYTSIKGLTTERTVYPDYIYWAGTNRHIMVSWDTSKNDWRAFVVDRIRKAKIEEEKEQQSLEIDLKDSVS